MKFLIIGLGSMGKRRIRNLVALGFTELAGFDPRPDRRLETEQRYEVETYKDIQTALELFSPDALIISTPPSNHMEYAFIGLERNLPCFIEASVVDPDKIFKLHNLVADTSLLMAPSCTMKYSAGPLKIKELLVSGVIGDPLNINYQTGQYLPDWHPWENIEEFYVSNRDTGGAREIVPFELTWLVDLFGLPKAKSCIKTKLTDISSDIDDVYHCFLEFPSKVLANLTVEVISQPKATRELRILGTIGTIVFSADENCVRYINVGMDEWVKCEFSQGTIENDYINPEEPYIAEMRDFVSAVSEQNKDLFPNTLLNDYNVLQTLHELEMLSENVL